MEKKKELPDVREALQHNYYTALKEAHKQFPPNTSMELLMAYALVKSATQHCTEHSIAMYCSFSADTGPAISVGTVLMCQHPYAAETIDSLAYLYDMDSKAGDAFCVEAMAALNDLLSAAPKGVTEH